MTRRRKKTPAPDVTIEGCGSFAIVRPESDAGRAWIKEHLIHEETILFGGGVACEPRYLYDIIDAMEGDDLVISP